MTSSEEKNIRKYFIGAHYNLNNGDRAVLEATVQQILMKDKDADITVSVYEPKGYADPRFRTVCWPLKKNKIIHVFFRLIQNKHFIKNFRKLHRILISKEYLRVISESDIILISGGHHITDILGKETFYELAINYLVPIFNNKKIILLPQSIGPIKSINEKLIAKYILDNVDEIAYRDETSKQCLDSLKVKSNYQYIPDIVFSLPTIKSDKQKSAKTLGIAIYCSYNKNRKKQLLSLVLNNLIEVIKLYSENNWSIKFISMDSNDISVSEKIINKLKNEGYTNISLEKPNRDRIENVVELFGSMDVILAYKTHSVIFSIINSVPLVSIAYHPKSTEFMRSIGLEKYAIDDNNATKDNLLSLLSDIDKNYDEIVAKEKKGTKDSICKLNNFFETNIIMKREA